MTRIALITGAGTGIGRGTARGLARRKIDVVLVGRRADRLEAVAREVSGYGVRAVPIVADVAVPAQRRQLVERVHDAVGPIDILVNNAAIYAGGDLSSREAEEIESAVQTNLIAPMELTRLFLTDLMERNGSVVLLGSTTSYVSLPYSTLYSTTKSGIRAFGEALRYELPESVHLLIAYPPPTDTDMTRTMSGGSGMAAFPRSNPDKVGERIVRALLKRERELFFPAVDRPLVYLHRFAPGLVHALLYSQRARFAEMMSARQALAGPQNGMAEALAQFRFCHKYSTVVAKGVKWRYIATGQGDETVLLLPGGPGRAEFAFEYILTFEVRYRVIAPDYPAPPGTVEEMLDGLVAILEAEGVENAHVVGGSYSGLIAQRFVRRYPERVAGMVLSDTGVSDPARARKYSYYLRMLQALPLGAIRAIWRLGAYLYLREVRQERTFWQSYFREMIATITKQECVGRLKAWIDFDRNSRFAPSDLAGWPGRILILNAEHDTTFPREEQAALRRLYPQAQVRKFRDGGHAASITYRKEYIAAIGDFVRAAAPPNEAAL